MDLTKLPKPLSEYPKEKVLTYQIYNEYLNSHVANIYYHPQTNKYSAEMIKAEGSPALFGLFEPGSIPNPEPDAVKFFLENRVLPPNRQNIQDILEESGVNTYNWRAMIRLNNGRTCSDHFRVDAISNIDLELSPPDDGFICIG